jgi:hypothetical protein
VPCRSGGVCPLAATGALSERITSRQINILEVLACMAQPPLVISNRIRFTLQVDECIHSECIPYLIIDGK